MPVKNSLVIYKNALACVMAESNGKFTVKFVSVPATKTKPCVYGEQSVRAKDFVLLCEEPCSSLEVALHNADEKSPREEDMYKLDNKNELFLLVQEAWEFLLSDDSTKDAAVSFEELEELFASGASPDMKYADFLAIKNTIFFKMDQKAFSEQKLMFIPRSQEEIDGLVKKADEKGREAEIRAAFTQRLIRRELSLPEDSKFMVEVEALALGKTDKCRAMADAKIKETPENAHKLLLETGVWEITRNPFPIRWGLSMRSASEGLASPPEEERITVSGVSYAIDNSWSTDPDDAVAFDGKYLWVHIADPASTVMPDSSIDRSARARGSTLYIPEGASRMLCEDCLEDYALGLTPVSRALSFRLLLDSQGEVEECQVMKTFVEVKRLTYEKADELMDSPELKPLFDIAWRNVERRNKSGAVQIDLPEVHITVDRETKKVAIEPEIHPRSSEMVREMMLLAGEGAAKFAFKNGIPFPFVSQEAPTLPEDVPEGLAGQFRLVKCMHRRSVGVTPAMHCGLGLSMYSQVTSPLRRYGDLIAHQQLRAFLAGEKLMDKDTMLMRISEGDAGAQAAHKAERKSDLHWTLVYLCQNPEWTGEAICIDKGPKGDVFMIPSLAQQCTMVASDSIGLNDKINVRAQDINIPDQTVNFVPV